jgi:hypothetical protein
MADKISGDSVAVRPIPEDAQSDSEAVQDKLKGSWWSRLWGTSDLDKQERKYVAKVDLYFL